MHRTDQIGGGGAEREKDSERHQPLAAGQREGDEDEAPSRAPRKIGEQTPFQPTNAPTIAIILMSPPPIASCLNSQVPPTADQPQEPESHRRAQSARPATRSRPARAEQQADDQAAEVNSSGMM